MGKRLSLIILLVAIAAAGYLFFQHRAEQASGSTPTAPFAQLREEWAADLAGHRLEPAVAHYAEDATFINPDGSHAQGSTQIRDLFASVFGVFDANIQFSSRSTSASGTLAYDSGSWTESITERATHELHQTSGDYLTIYRKDPDGQWRIVEQAWTEAAIPK